MYSCAHFNSSAGQERYRTITSAYYRGADGIIMVYDITNEDSFRHIHDWLQEVNRYAAETTSKLLVGNKADLNDQRVISFDKGKALAEELHIPFMEASALDATNVQAAFEHITRSLLSKNHPAAASPAAKAPSKGETTKVTAQNASNGGGGSSSGKKSGCC